MSKARSGGAEILPDSLLFQDLRTIMS